jgi:putative transposase
MAEMERMTAEEVVRHLLEDEGGADLVRDSLRWLVQQLMEAEVSEQIGAAHGERREDRATWRNGYRPRRWDTRAGELELRIPKLRQGSYFPSFLEPRRRSEQALLAVVQQAYVCGVSTRRVDQLVESLGLRVSRSEVSRICALLDEQVEAFRCRPLEGDYPYLWLDGKAEKVRDGGRVVNKCVVIAYGVHETGRREILGIDVGESETEAFWTEFLRSLIARGLRGVQLVVSDAHEGLKAAIARLLRCPWQHCTGALPPRLPRPRPQGPAWPVRRADPAALPGRLGGAGARATRRGNHGARRAAAEGRRHARRRRGGHPRLLPVPAAALVQAPQHG